MLCSVLRFSHVALRRIGRQTQEETPAARCRTEAAERRSSTGLIDIATNVSGVPLTCTTCGPGVRCALKLPGEV